jgi:galactose mutarotase-like enzyme
MLNFATDDAELTIDPTAGGRITSLRIGGRELIVWRRKRTVDWGAYPMAPFAGRLRDARFVFDGFEHRLPANEGPHAIHGTTLEGDWQVVDDETIAVDLGAPWPFGGRVTQRTTLEPGRLTQRLTLDADESMPAVIGFHPWLVRRPRRVGDTTGATAAEVGLAGLTFRAEAMYERDAVGLPTGRLLSPPPSPPWDDCFVDVRQGPTIRWPGFLELQLASDARHWVVYTGDADALAIEPQTGPPDGPNIEPRIISPGQTLALSMTWTWRRIDG